MNWRIESLKASHDRAQFTCGQTPLDDYLRHYANQHTRKGIGRTFVAVLPPARQIFGFYTLASSSVAFEHAPTALQRKLPRYPLPVALLGRLAVDQSTQGQGLGEFLLLDVCHRVAAIAEEIGLCALEVHALNDAATAFYKKYGFQPFLDRPNHLILPMATLQQLF